MDEIAYGIIMAELERGDSGIRSMASVQGSLVMYPIFRFASEEQKRKYLPKLATGELIAVLGFEPIMVQPRRHGDQHRGYGDAHPQWFKNVITNSPVEISLCGPRMRKASRGMVVEKDTPGFSAPEIHGKWSLRASITGELVFSDECLRQCLPDIRGLKAPLSCLSKARYGIAWVYWAALTVMTVL